MWWNSICGACGRDATVFVALDEPRLICLLKEKQSEQEIINYLNSHFDCYNDCDDNDKSALMWAVDNNSIKIVKRLLSMGADVDAVDNLGQNPLFYSIKNNNTEMNKLLVSKGVNVHQINNKEETLIHIACEYGFVEVAQWLIELGINFNAKDSNGVIALEKLESQEHVVIIEGCVFRKLLLNDKDGEPITGCHMPSAASSSPIVDKSYHCSPTYRIGSPSGSALHSVTATPFHSTPVSRAASFAIL